MSARTVKRLECSMSMATRKVIAFYMHDDERAAAQRLMPAAVMTDSFAMGEVDESKIPELEQAGIMVQVQPAAPPSGPGAGVSGVTTRPVTRSASFDIGPRAPSTSTPSTSNDAIGPAVVDYYVVNLRGPLMEPWREQLAALRVELLELLPDRGYKARLHSTQVPLVSKLDFVQSVTWLDPGHSAAKRVTRSMPPSFGLSPPAGRKMLTYDVRVHDPADLGKVQHGHRATDPDFRHG